MTSMETTCLTGFNRSFSIGKLKTSKVLWKTISAQTEIGSAYKMMENFMVTNSISSWISSKQILKNLRLKSIEMPSKTTIVKSKLSSSTS
jgi:hypothetical protein